MSRTYKSISPIATRLIATVGDFLAFPLNPLLPFRRRLSRLDCLMLVLFGLVVAFMLFKLSLVFRYPLFERAAFALGAVYAFCAFVNSGGQGLKRSALEAESADSRAPVLMLRAFSVDSIEVSVYSPSPLGLSERSRRLEEVVISHFKELGPPVAVGDWREMIPKGGSARGYFENDSWRDYVKIQCSRAVCIIVFLENSAELRWEISQVASQGGLYKTVVIFPPWDPKDPQKMSMIRSELEWLWSSLANALGELPSDIVDWTDVVGVYFDDKGARWLLSKRTSEFGRKLRYFSVAEKYNQALGELCSGEWGRRVRDNLSALPIAGPPPSYRPRGLQLRGVAAVLLWSMALFQLSPFLPWGTLKKGKSAEDYRLVRLQFHGLFYVTEEPPSEVMEKALADIDSWRSVESELTLRSREYSKLFKKFLTAGGSCDSTVTPESVLETDLIMHVESILDRTPSGWQVRAINCSKVINWVTCIDSAGQETFGVGDKCLAKLRE